jgi:serine/threonine-protein kinase
MLVGTPAFMAPEQMRSATVDARADVWALGVTLFWLLTGQRPFKGEGIVKIYESILRGAPPVRTLRPDVPEALEQVVSNTLVWNPEERLASVRELMNALLLFRAAPSERPPSGERVMQRPEQPPPSTELIDPAAIALSDPPPRFALGRRRAVQLGAGVAIAALAFGSYALGAAQGGERALAVQLLAPDVAMAAESAARALSAEPPAEPLEAPPAETKPAAPAGRAPRPAPLRPPPRSTKSDKVWGRP